MGADGGASEATLLHDKNIAAALLFGRNHIEVGVLINPASNISIPPGDKEKEAEYIDSIWCVSLAVAVGTVLIICRPVIEKANSTAPKYANIARKVSHCA